MNTFGCFQEGKGRLNGDRKKKKSEWGHWTRKVRSVCYEQVSSVCYSSVCSVCYEQVSSVCSVCYEQVSSVCSEGEQRML
jgi:hypothetical protein